MNKKLTRIREKSGKTAIDRRRIAAKKVPRVRAVAAARAEKIAEATQPVDEIYSIPWFLRIDADECVSVPPKPTPVYRVPNVFRQPDIAPGPSGLCGRDVTRVRPTHAHHERSPRLGLLIIILVAVAFYGAIYAFAGRA